VRLLIDTHCWLWLQVSPERLAPEVLSLLGDPDNEILLSAASSWEIAIKVALGRLELPAPPEAYVPQRLAADGISGMAVEHVHALRAGALPRHHQDPFDRLLIAQAQLERMGVLTADSAFLSYDVDVVWAGLAPPRPPKKQSR